MVVRSIKRLVGVLFDVLAKVDHFILLVDFVVLDCKLYQVIPIIVGWFVQATGQAIVDMEQEEINFRVKNNEVSFRVC